MKLFQNPKETYSDATLKQLLINRQEYETNKHPQLHLCSQLVSCKILWYETNCLTYIEHLYIAKVHIKQRLLRLINIFFITLIFKCKSRAMDCNGTIRRTARATNREKNTITNSICQHTNNKEWSSCIMKIK